MSVSTKFILRTKGATDENEHPIMLQIIINRKNQLVSTKQNSNIKNWNADSQLVKAAHPKSKDTNSTLKAISSDIHFLILSAGKKGELVTFDDIKGIAKKLTGAQERPKSCRLFEAFEEHLIYLKSMERLGDAEIFKSTLNSLKTFTNKKDIDLLSVKTDFIRRYEDHLVLRGSAITTRSVYLRTFRRLWNIAIKNELCPKDHYPFKDFEFSKYNKPRTKKRAISKEQIDKIAAIVIPPENDTLLNSKNYFMFSFYCRGLNFTDLASLKWDNIKDGDLNYVRTKTKEQFQFKLHPEALNIIDYYKKMEGNSDAGYIFPILYKRHDTAAAIRYRKKKVLKMLNSEIKTLAKMVGIEKNLTSYVARHSFATALLRGGVEVEKIQQSLGHDDLETTKIYLEDVGDPLFDDMINSSI